jgi:subtilisin-like proprotein convertase family protein
VDTPYRGDLDVFLRSPRGRVRWLSTHDGEDDQSNLILTDADISEAFLGTNPNGLWQLFLRDVFPSDRALFQSVELEVSAR